MASEKGREIVLSREVPDEAFVMTTACLISYGGYNAVGIVEQDIEAISNTRKYLQSPSHRLSSIPRKYILFLWAMDGINSQLFHLVFPHAMTRYTRI
jgi:hypothetical protein